jgi:AcrR family transcriptional regulator
MSETDNKQVRADARRNYGRLLEAAVLAFATDGTHVSLERIAKDAGVGIGTLYRHFPTREALVEAVYRHELADLCDAVPGLLQSLPPDEATRAWMDHFIDYMNTKHYMAEALRAVIASGGDPFAESRRRLVAAITALLDAGATAGTLRSDLDPNDVLVALNGVSLAAGRPNQRKQAGRLLDLLVEGLRQHVTAPELQNRSLSHRPTFAERSAPASADA